MIGTAAMAGAVAGLGGLGGKGLVVLPHQIFVGHTVVHVAPRGHLVQPNGTLAVELGINAQILIAGWYCRPVRSVKRPAAKSRRAFLTRRLSPTPND